MRLRVLLVVTGVATVAGWALATAWRSAGRALPDPGWALVIPVVLIVALVLGLGWNIRSYLRGSLATRPRAHPSPQRARATLGAAQAAALGGAILAGLFLALLLGRLPNLDVPSVRDDAIRYGVLALVSGLPIAAGLLVQSWCRLPPEDDDDSTPPEAAHD